MRGTLYRVQLWPNGRWDRQPWRVVVAESEDEAARKATGEPVAKAAEDEVPPVKLRARVVRAGSGQPVSFYAA
jgi:hypothetical protein